MRKLSGISYRWIGLGGLALGLSAGAATNLNLNGGLIYGYSAINPADVGLTFTNSGVRDLTVSIGQLCGVDPQSGTVLTNAGNLLPLKAQSLDVVGSLSGDGSGLTNLHIQVGSLPTSGVWNASGVTIVLDQLRTVGSMTPGAPDSAPELGSIAWNGEGLVVFDGTDWRRVLTESSDKKTIAAALDGDQLIVQTMEGKKVAAAVAAAALDALQPSVTNMGVWARYTPSMETRQTIILDAQSAAQAMSTAMDMTT